MRWFRRKPRTLTEIFHHLYYKTDTWRSSETWSGPGSSLRNTEKIRKEIPDLLKQYNIKSMLDAPCGDFNWMQKMDLTGIDYTGIDIIPELIEENRKKYPGRNFIAADITIDKLPQADLVLSRDCFIHLPNKLVVDAISNFKKSGITFMLTNTYDFIKENKEIEPGEFRMLNMQKPPFNFSRPLYIIEEEFNDNYPDKKLALWRIG